MNTNNAAKPAQPGDTFIAYIDDDTASVGVVIETDEDERKWKTLVLGHFKDERRGSGRDVFLPPFPYSFPGYMAIMKLKVVPYDFKLEIALCKTRDSAWWKSLGAPCYTNLVAKHFRPRQLQELQYIDMARHILQGKDIDSFKSFGYWSEETYLKMWAVLYRHFPRVVAQPPRERDVCSSNVYYTIDLDSDPPTVTSGTRPHEYQRDDNNLSRY
jgi:hypothetical protein